VNVATRTDNRSFISQLNTEHDLGIQGLYPDRFSDTEKGNLDLGGQPERKGLARLLHPLRGCKLSS